MNNDRLEEEISESRYDSAVAREMIAYAKPYLRWFVLAFLLVVLATISDLSIPYITKIAIDQCLTPISGISFDNRFQYLLILVAALIGILVARFAVSLGQSFIIQSAGQKILRDLRQKVFSHLLRLPIRYFDRNPIGRLITRATNDVAAVSELYSAVLVNSSKDILLIIGVFTFMLLMNWRLALVVMIFFPFLILISWLFRRTVRVTYQEIRRKIARLNAYLSESLSGIRIIHQFNFHHRAADIYGSINEEELEAGMKEVRVSGGFRPMIGFLNTATTVGVLYFGGREVIDGALSLGSLIAFLAYLEMMYMPIVDLAEKYNIFESALASSERIFSLLNEPPENIGGDLNTATIKGSLEFRDVWFAYEDENWVLEGVSFFVNQGEILGIVGPSGSGKTTIASLLFRFYDIQRGQILLDGIDIRNYNIHELRSAFALVSQDVFIFSGNIKTNVALHSDEIEDNSINDAISKSMATHFVDKLDGGLDAILNERGTVISAGERQLLSIARAVASKPKVLVLDEATASIDSHTEDTLQTAIREIMRDCTSIVVAHRLSTIVDADRIIVLQGGKILEVGTHQNLISQNGLYAALYSLQIAQIKSHIESNVIQ